jgi:septal ring factor EnvC (AmiA/AmiB activator)
LAGIGIYKACEHFIPFEIKRREVPPPLPTGRTRARGAAKTTSSESEIERAKLSRDVTPAPELLLKAAAERADAAEQKVKALELELTDVKGSLDKERKERAEQAATSSRLRSQLQNLSRTAEKNAAEIARLTAELAAYREAKIETTVVSDAVEGANVDGQSNSTPPKVADNAEES